MLKHPDWRVRAEAIELVRVLHRRSAIPLLFELLERWSGRLVDDVTRALTSLTGKRLGADPRPWRLWWQQARDSFVMPDQPQERPRGDAGSGTRFYGVDTQSRRILFVLDRSGSMKSSSRSKTGRSTASKFGIASAQLKTALHSLPTDATFNVLVYSDRPQRLFPEVVEATAENKRQALAQLQSVEPGGGTNIYAALADAFALVERNAKSRRDGSPQIDTLYFLSDGQPNMGRMQRADLILADIRVRNSLLGLRIHTIGVGAHDADFMAALANEHRGTYVAFGG
jgi:hypothetical protein